MDYTYEFKMFYTKAGQSLHVLCLVFIIYLLKKQIKSSK